jgi:hypothetical protein
MKWYSRAFEIAIICWSVPLNAYFLPLRVLSRLKAAETRAR